MGSNLDRPALAAHDLHLLLQAELLSLQFAEADSIGLGTTQFVFDRAFEMLVTDAKFANTGFDCHDRTSM